MGQFLRTIFGQDTTIPLMHTAWHCPLSLSNSSITYTHAHQCQAHFTVRPQPPLCVAGGQRSLYCCVNTGTQAHTLHLINGPGTLDMTAQPSLQDPAVYSAKDCSVLLCYFLSIAILFFAEKV